MKGMKPYCSDESDSGLTPHFARPHRRQTHRGGPGHEPNGANHPSGTGASSLARISHRCPYSRSGRAKNSAAVQETAQRARRRHARPRILDCSTAVRGLRRRRFVGVFVDRDATGGGEVNPYYSDETVTLWAGDCIDVMRTMADGSADAVVTDPPYGLEFMGKDWDGADGFRRSLNPNDVGRDNAFGRTSAKAPEYRTDSKAQASSSQRGGHSATDGRPTFLGGLNPKCLVCDHWQRGSNPCKCEAPQWTQERLVRLHVFQEWCEQWATECLRVLKPGGYLLAFGGSRTWHRLAAAVEDSGFEIRDSIAWLYGSGFPKSLNLGDGRGTALKPAFEPIVMGRKPLIGTVAANVERHGTGVLNIDSSRVPGAG